jgi:hypothetical protein
VGRHRILRTFVFGLMALGVACAATPPQAARAQEGEFLTEEQAPAAVFPDADGFARQVVSVTPDVRSRMHTILGQVEPSIWEEEYLSFKATRGAVLLGYAVIVEEIGKHRPITFVVGVRANGGVNDVAVMAYREAYGGEVKSQRFLGQYRGKAVGDRLQPYTEIKNIAGATLSVDAASRAVKKALALAHVALGVGGQS